MDLIDRQEAIDVIDKIFPADPMRNDYTQGITCGAALAMEYIKQLPSAQQETHDKRTETHACDCISRQQAIDGADAIIARDTSGNNDVVKAMTAWKSYVEALPSAQPEIIRCKDCRWHNGEIDQCNAQICASMYGDDFCSRAERRSE